MTEADRCRARDEAQAMLDRWARAETRDPREHYDYDVLIVRHLMTALESTKEDPPC